MKLTQWSQPPSAINQVPGKATVSGDIRLTPFYDLSAVQKAVEGYVKDINEKITELPGRGPVFKHELADGSRGRIELEWLGSPCLGVYCDLESAGYKAIAKATEEVIGEIKPESLTGSLPCVGELKQAGFDIQICGYGIEKVYHGLNEYASLNDLKQGGKIMRRIITLLNEGQ